MPAFLADAHTYTSREVKGGRMGVGEREEKRGMVGREMR
jgi:hypothetical protein